MLKPLIAWNSINHPFTETDGNVFISFRIQQTRAESVFTFTLKCYIFKQFFKLAMIGRTRAYYILAVHRGFTRVSFDDARISVLKVSYVLF